VRAQFLTEAGLISILGGSLGVAAGVLFAKALTLVSGWPTDLDPRIMLATFVFVALTGIFFGWYPASRAAGTDPIDALYAE
jgi:putative ABC transport system permease protein